MGVGGQHSRLRRDDHPHGLANVTQRRWCPAIRPTSGEAGPALATRGLGERKSADEDPASSVANLPRPSQAFFDVWAPSVKDCESAASSKSASPRSKRLRVTRRSVSVLAKQNGGRRGSSGTLSAKPLDFRPFGMLMTSTTSQNLSSSRRRGSAASSKTA